MMSVPLSFMKLLVSRILVVADEELHLPDVFRSCVVSDTSVVGVGVVSSDVLSDDVVVDR